jgi:hypothetical protein
MQQSTVEMMSEALGNMSGHIVVLLYSVIILC